MTDKLAIVTGTSSGIGEALAGDLLRRGWTVVGIARRAVQRTEPEYHHVQHDLADVPAFRKHLEPQLAAILESRRWKHLGLVNNAADPGQLRTITRLDPDSLHRALAVNAVAPIGLMGFCARLRPKGVPLRIVNISSGLATQPFPGIGDYCVSKAALRMAGIVMSAEHESTGRGEVSVLSYDPGVVETSMQEMVRSQSKDDFPSVDFFHELHRSGALVSPDLVVRPIIEYLEGPAPEGFSETQYLDDGNE